MDPIDDEIATVWLPKFREYASWSIARRHDHAMIYHDGGRCDRSCPAEAREALDRRDSEHAESLGLGPLSPEPQRRERSQPFTHRIPFEDVQKMRAAVGRK